MGSKARSIPGGLVIVFEGLDGVGKTTQLQLAAEVLQKEGWAVETVRNLGGTPIGEALRAVSFSPIERPPITNLYISVAIQSALIEKVAKERGAGKVILFDRGPLSMAAYQIYGGSADDALGWSHVADGMKNFRPELTMLYEADIETAIARNRKTNKADYYEKQPLAYFKRVQRGFAIAAQRYPVVEIDARQSIAAIHRQTMKLIEQLLDAHSA